MVFGIVGLRGSSTRLGSFVRWGTSRGRVKREVTGISLNRIEGSGVGVGGSGSCGTGRIGSLSRPFARRGE